MEQDPTLRILVKLWRSCGRSDQVKDLLGRVVGVAQRSQLSVCQRLGKREAISPVQMDVVVNEWREPLDVFRLNQYAGYTKLVQRQAHVARVPQDDRI